MTITAVYTTAAAAYGRPFNPDQCASWNRALRDFTVAEIQAAVDQWQRNTATDFDGRSLGSKLPQPADLRAICQNQREHETRRKSGDFVSCGKCDDGWRRVFEGRTAKGNLIDATTGAMTMCDCKVDHLCRYFHCTRQELSERLRKHREERAKKHKNE